MIELDNFVSLVRKAIPQFRDYPPNPSQEQCITHLPETPLMIVAGPGSGKTTVLVLRALRLVFVDGLRPEEILVTTIHKKSSNRNSFTFNRMGIGSHQSSSKQLFRSGTGFPKVAGFN